MAAGFWFAIAASMKVYPVVLLLLFVRSRDRRTLGASILTGLTATWISFVVYDGGMLDNSTTLWDSVSNFRSESLETLLLRDHSLKCGLAALVVSGPGWLQGTAQWTIDHYDPIFGILALFLVGLAVSRSTPTFNAVLYLSIFISYGVGISFVYVPLLLAVIVVYVGQVEQSRSSNTAIIVLALLLAPKGFPVGGRSIALSTYLDPALALGALLALIVADPRKIVAGRRRGRPRIRTEEVSPLASTGSRES
jgi:hypothetical protein